MKIKSPRSLLASVIRNVRSAPAPKSPGRRPLEGDRFEPRLRPRLHPRLGLRGLRPLNPRTITPDTFTGPKCGTNGSGPKCGTNGGTSTFTPAPAPTPAPVHVPVSTPAPTPAPVSTPAGGGCSAPNPFSGGKGLTGPITNGPFFTLGKPDADLTWDGLAKLFAEGKVIGDTGGSCGMSGAEKVEALRQFWDQCVASGKSPAESGFYVRCGPNGVPGLHT